jgi:hypothetical protein
MTNFRFYNEQTVNGLKKNAWASVSVFRLKRQYIYMYMQSWAHCVKSARHKLFFVAPQCKPRSSKAQLPSLRFNILDATFNSNFYNWIWYGENYLDWLL